MIISIESGMILANYYYCVNIDIWSIDDSNDSDNDQCVVLLLIIND